MSIKPVSKLLLPITIVLSLLFTATAYAAENTPEGVVKSYYADAYDLLTPRMIDGRTKKEYAADWKNIVDMASVILHEYGISSVEIDGETAKVNAWTRASDVFNTDGIIEKEVDHLILTDGVWKLDATEVSMEAVDM